MLSVGSLFTGIGGIDLGLERAGMETKWMVEIDPFCLKVLNKHWPKVGKYEDIREVGSDNLAPVDLICGGFPCQPHSLAGKRNASEDERDLWGEMFRVICEIKPRWVLAENVPGLLSSEAGRFFGRVLRDLASVGYDVEWESIPAAAFGAPHIRERVFILANCDSELCEKRGDDSSNEGESGRWRDNERRGGSDDSRELDSAENENVANAESIRSEGRRKRQRRICPERDDIYVFAGCGEVRRRDKWQLEPAVGRVANGVSSRVDRLRSLGNAVVPQVAEWIGRRIIETNYNME